MAWISLSSLFSPSKRASRQANLRLVQAYRRLFSGKGDDADAKIVLADLATYSGFYRVFPSEVEDSTLRFTEGRRSVYGRVLRFLRLSEGELEDLEEAARQEALAAQQEGVL